MLVERVRVGALRAACVVVAALVPVLGSAAPASAHGDELLFDGDLLLFEGESASFTGDVHYHRLVAEITANHPVVVSLVDERTGTVRVERPPSLEVRINELVRCCDDDAWTPHHLVIENPGEVPVSVDARASLVHDDLAVMAYRAEAGTTESVGILGAAWAAVLWRRRRRDVESTPRRAVVSLAVVVALTLGLAAFGAWRYGLGSAPAVVAGTGDVPILPRNPIVSRASLLMGLGMIGWAVAAARWVAARASMPGVAWALTGVGVAGAPAVVAYAVATTYGTAGMPVALAVAALAPLVVAAVMAGRGSGETVTVGSDGTI